MNDATPITTIWRWGSTASAPRAGASSSTGCSRISASDDFTLMFEV